MERNIAVKFVKKNPLWFSIRFKFPLPNNPEKNVLKFIMSQNSFQCEYERNFLESKQLSAELGIPVNIDRTILNRKN